MKNLILFVFTIIGSAAQADPSPFARIEALYNKAQPMPLSVLPKIDDAQLQSWQCSGAKRSTSEEDFLDQINDGLFAPVHVYGAKDIETVMFLKNDLSDLPTVEEITEFTRDLNQNLVANPGLTITFDFAENNAAQVVSTYRYIQEGAVTRVIAKYEGAMYIPFLYDYVICTKI